MHNKRVILVIENLEKLYSRDINSNNCIIMDTSFDYTKYLGHEDIHKANTIYNYRFEPPITKSDTLKYLYSCECGKKTGYEELGHTCEKCDTDVTRTKYSFDFRGWFILDGGIKAMNPNAFKLMKSVLTIKDLRGKKKKPDKKKLKKEERKRKEEEKRKADCIKRGIEYIPPKTPRKKKTKLSDFNERELRNIDIIIDNRGVYHMPVNGIPDKSKWVEYMRDEKALKALIEKRGKKSTPEQREAKQLLLKSPLLTYCIPVVSSKGRTYSVSDIANIAAVSNDELNTLLIKLSGHIHRLNACLKNHASDRILSNIVPHIQNIWNEIYTKTLDILGTSKKSVVRAELFGKRQVKTGRAILEPLAGGKVDECAIPYDMYRVLMSGVVTDYMKKHSTAVLKAAKKKPHMLFRYISDMINTNYVMNEDDYNLLDKIFEVSSETNDLTVNREPSIYYSSILGLRIKMIERSSVLRVSPLVLSAIAGDHDGDALNIAILPVGAEERTFHNMKPQNYILNWLGDWSGAIGLVDTMCVASYMSTKTGSDVVETQIKMIK